MSRQKTRIASDGSDAALAEKKKARHRLVGAIALCLLAAIIVPMLLESEPRNGQRTLPLTMADARPSADGDSDSADWSAPPSPPPGTERDPGEPERLVMLEERRVEPAQPPGGSTPPLPGEPSARSQSSGQPPPAANAVGAQREQQKADRGASDAPLRPPVPAVPANRPQAPAESHDVLARLIDQVNPGSSSGSARPAERRNRRFLLQVGAYSNVKSARLASDRVGKAGMTAYHETVKTANGDWIRVRIGPFDSREQAEQAQQTLKRAGVTAALIAL
ncbi:MAG: SPOR domain-containing protein [Lautropia sp.]|nr:SPOR domain-containing protein [Lautropia sp.]